MKKILHFIYGLGVGGAETFISNVLTKLTPDEYHFDFALQDGKIENAFLSDYIERNNSTIYVLPRFPRHILGQFKLLRRILLQNHYDFVHIHMNAAVNPVPLLVSHYNYRNTKFILHSHNTSSANRIGRILHIVNSRSLIKGSNIKVACSELAGRWMFNEYEFSQIDNAIDINKFRFSPTCRNAIRKEFNIAHTTSVIGSIGRFVSQKNHSFMIEWFTSYSAEHPEAILLLVGEGPLFANIKQLVAEKRIEDKVVFTGLRTDTSALLSAMDCFIMPSHFEGLAFTAIEAQASGLCVVASDNLPKIINLKEHCRFLSLNASYANWSKAVDKALICVQRENRINNPVEGSQFDIDVMIHQIKKIYS